jgi:hypothetical protein
MRAAGLQVAVRVRGGRRRVDRDVRRSSRRDQHAAMGGDRDRLRLNGDENRALRQKLRDPTTQQEEPTSGQRSESARHELATIEKAIEEGRARRGLASLALLRPARHYQHFTRQGRDAKDVAASSAGPGSLPRSAELAALAAPAAEQVCSRANSPVEILYATAGSDAPGPVADDRGRTQGGGLLSPRAAWTPLDAAPECRRQRVENVGAYRTGPRRAPQAPRARKRPGEAVALLGSANRTCQSSGGPR